MSLARIYSELMYVGAPITKVYPSTELTKGGILVDDTYLIQLTKEQDFPILLNIVAIDGQLTESATFNSVNELIQFIMEN